MSCRRVSRELLERFRFGEELDARSEPHLLHLQSCGPCRDEVGLDRALVAQLRRALRERVADAAPSEASWSTVRERAMAAKTAQPAYSPLVRRLRLMPAAAAISVMVFAVAVARDAELPTAIHLETHPSYQAIPPADPKWELPWYLRYETVQPLAPSRGGPIRSDFNEPTEPPPARTSGPLEQSTAS